MELSAKEVLQVLREKNVSALYHANSVQTSCLFLRDAHLISRGTADERGLSQTGQQTDEKDKKLGVWYDLFLDSVDIHKIE